MVCPMSKKIAIVTLCKGRLAHLRVSLPLMLAQFPDEMVVVDYSCPEGSGDWVEANFPSVKVVRILGQVTFNASHARNEGWAACSSPWVICLDADITPMPGWLDWLRPRLRDESVYFRSSPVNGSRSMTSYGMACVSRTIFNRVGGYDEVFSGWGAEDTDFFERVQSAGFVEDKYPNHFLARINHSDEERTRYYEIKDPFVSQIANRLYSLAKQTTEIIRQSPVPLKERKRMMVLANKQVEKMLLSPSYEPSFGISLADYTIKRTGDKSQCANSGLETVVFKRNIVISAQVEKVVDSIGSPQLPKISCLMVTKGRIDSVSLSIACFLKQSYSNKELIIVTDIIDISALKKLVEEQPTNQIRLLKTKKSEMLLGDLRNIAVDYASGEFICQWDDDDLFHPSRLTTQYHALRKHGADACLLARWMLWWPSKMRLAVSGKRQWEGSLLCRKSVMPAYPSLKMGEDTPLVEQLMKNNRVVNLDVPELYLYIYHGRNTFTSEHFSKIYEHASEKFEGEVYEDAYQKLLRNFPLDEYPIG